MFYIKSDDIDELFREAAEKYHIDTKAAEAWDDVQAAVHADDAPPPPPPQGNGGKRRWFVLGWLLLIPLGWFAHNAWTAINEHKAKSGAGQFAKAGNNKAANKANSQEQYKHVNDNKQTAVATTTREEENKDINEKPPALTSSNTLPFKKGTELVRVRQASITGNNSNTRPGGSTGPGLLNTANGSRGTITAENAAGYAKVVNGSTPSPNNGTEKSADILKNQPARQAVASAVDNSAQSVANPPASRGEATANEQGNRHNKNDSNKPKAKNGHFFYVGLSAAPDASFIHFQKTSTMGVGAGLLVGYQFSKKFSLESGALIEKKYYYTSGEYFDISKVAYFVNNNIHPKTATGNCNMVEIPLNLQYTFTTKGNNSFYALGGISSYLMGKESYTFNYDVWSRPAQSTWGYNNPEGYWLSILNIGAGYARKIGKNTNLRIEPYMKLPLSGIGTGDLKIASAGLYLTLTRRIP